MINYKRRQATYMTRAILIAAAICMLLQPMSVFAQSLGFTNEDKLYIGSIVSFKTEDATDLAPANVNNQRSLVGVVIPDGSATYSIESDLSNVRTTAEGIVDTLVSNINGDIAVGDYISASQINGVGMKADDGVLSQRLVGIAIADFNAAGVEKATYNLPGIEKENVEIARIPVQLLIRGSVDNDDSEKALITRIGESIVGRPVTFFQTTVAILLFFLTLSVSSVLLYGAIIGSFTSLGRNPLAAKVIVANLVRVTAISLFVLLFGVGAAYGVLLI